MVDPHAILACVNHNEAPEEWLIVRPKDSVRGITIFMSVISAIFLFPELMILTLVVPYMFGYSDPNPFPWLLHAPWVWLPALSLPVALVYGVRRAEKNKTDAVLILLPGGIVECERWSKEHKRRIKLFEYANIESLTLKMAGGTITFHPYPESNPYGENYVPQIHSEGLIFEIVYRDGKRDKWPHDSRYFSRTNNTFIQRIITDYVLHAQDKIREK